MAKLHKGGKRQKCRGFSRRARNSMMRTLFAIDESRIGTGVFVTLTYPVDHPTARASKRDLDTYLKRLFREHPDVSGFWKLEPQKRGAPHYHLLLFFPVQISDEQLSTFHEWSAVAWYQVVGSNNPHHLYVNRRAKSCTKLESWDGALSYGSKYVGKMVDDLPGWSDAGRYWGTHRRKLLPIKLVTEDVEPGPANLLRRTMRRFLASQLTGRVVVQDPESGKIAKRGHVDAAALKLWKSAGYKVHQVKRGRSSRSSGGLSLFLRSSTSLRLLAWAKAQPASPTAQHSLARSVQRHHLSPKIPAPGLTLETVRVEVCPHLRWSPADKVEGEAWQLAAWAERASECFG